MTIKTRLDLPPDITRALVALSCDDEKFVELYADEVGNDGQLRHYSRTQYMALLWVTITDLVALATMDAREATQ